MNIRLPKFITKKRVLYTFTSLVVLIIAFFIFYLLIPTDRYERHADIIWGATFSKRLAQNYDLDWKDVYIRMLDDLNIKSLRLSAYWDEIEMEKGKFDFTDLDWQINEAKKRNVDVILAIGYKLPRWPECRKPFWFEGDSKSLFVYLKKYLNEVISHYESEDTVFTYQVENEPLFDFGICFLDMGKYYSQEIEYVKELTDKPIMTSDSGELSFWIKSTKSGADILGISTYRIVYNPYTGYFDWFFLTPNFYRKKTQFINKNITDVYLSELQAEPWSGQYLTELSLDEQLDIFDEKKLLRNLQFAKDMQMPRVYLWGAEWWYYLNDKHNYSSILDTVKHFIK